MARTIATLNAIGLGAGLELRDGGMIVTYDSAGAPLARNARSTLGVSSGRHYWECVVYGDGSNNQAADTAAIGIVASGTTASTWPGIASNTAGYRPGDGALVQNGTTAAAGPAAPLRTVIGLALDLVAVAPTLRIYVNQLLVHTFPLAAGLTWHPAVSICGLSAYAFSMFVNFGRRPLEHAVPADYRAGLFESPRPFNTLRVASEDWTSGAAPTAGSPANTLWRGDIVGARDFVLDDGVTFWTMGQRGTTSSASMLTLDNRDGRYDDLLLNPPRNARVIVRLVDADDPASVPQIVGTALVDKPDESDRDVLRLRLRSPLSAFDDPAGQRYYLPWVVDGTQARVRPRSYGACRNVDGTLVDDVTRIYDAHDEALTQIAGVRERGDLLDPLAAPPDYSISPDQRGVGLQTEALGKVTMDVSSAGRPLIVGAPDVDVLDGYGAMTTDASGMPAQWIAVALARATAERVSTDGGRLRTSSTDGLPGADPTWFWDVRFRDLRATHSWLTIRKGCYYRLTYKIRNTLWPPNARPDQFSGGWYVAGTAVLDAAGTIAGALVPGEYTVDFRAACDGTLAWRGFGRVDPFGPGLPGDGPWWVEIDDVVCRLKSADTPDLMAGYGNFVGSLDRWVDHGTSVGCEVDYTTIVSSQYPSPGLGAMLMTIAAGAGKQCGQFYGSDTLLPDVPYRLALSMAGSDLVGRVRVIAWDDTDDTRYEIAVFAGGECEVRFQVGTPCYVLLEAYTATGVAGVVMISQVRCVDIEDQLNESSSAVPLQGISLADYYATIIERRGAQSAAAWVRADAEALDAETGFVFGVHSKEATTGRAFLEAPLDSYTAALTPDELGRVRIVRLRAPELADDAEVVLELDGNNGADTEYYVVDDAPGLTLRAGARRNWSIYTDNDFVEDFDPVTGVDAATRTRFKRLSQFVVTSAAVLPELYSHARDAAPIDTLLDLSTHAQTAVDYACGLYGVVRVIYRRRVEFEGLPPPVRPGVIVRRWSARLGAKDGKKLFALRVRRAPLGGWMEISGWG